MNDPNGLVFFEGRYHLFYQYNPQAAEWGNMSWGHASSADLLHWTEHPVAMANTPQEDIFSGSIVLDAHNRSGLGNGDSPVLVALYTSVYKEGTGHAPGTQAQSLAYSTDGGTSWHKYAANPVLTLAPESKQFRDPKVFWHAPSDSWIMATVVADAQVVKLYRSRNLRDWEFLSDFGPTGYTRPGMLWEMPDLFPLPLDGDAGKAKWVMIVNVNPWSIAGGSGTQYFIGHFDGTRFVAEDVATAGSDPARYRWLDHGADYYAAGTFANAPAGKAITIGWMSNWDYASQAPTRPWKGAMALPRELSLRTVEGVPRLVSTPVEQYTRLVAAHQATQWPDITLDGASRDLGPQARGQVLDIALRLHPSSAQQLGIVVRASADGARGTRIILDPAAKTLTVDRSAAGESGFSPKFSTRHIVHVPLSGEGELALHIVVDRGSVEVFAADGSVVVTDLIFPDPADDHVRLFAQGGRAEFRGLQVTSLLADE
ncbi:glycoside hydrolase family 32 protein [Pseudoxanthomonas sp.]|uniref:glycoside hydrolase family 32 protein n=1 Tax=Pseudoxanthomonas sp. TaxID=1871049 RepID=UPI00263A2850|nr:glycoside hydrolase family 32 protein [Pseudoxanthomonas sp.]WDS37137.1 MAG: glycoside hydrolase family 32 protein [Pseudoxanthomonas sp.]